MNPVLRPLVLSCLWGVVCGAGLTGCKGLPFKLPGVGEGGEKAAASKPVDVDFLLSMTWAEAKAISPQQLEVPPFYKVAADEIQVLKRDEAGKPRRVRATGHVFMQVDFQEQLTSLGQEAYVESGGELIMRGKPLLKRGRSLVEGLSDLTVFYIKGTRLQVIGSHRLVRKQSGAEPFAVKPTWTRSWKEGPNPLLPALSPDDVPMELRVNPLLPLPAEDNLPKVLPPEGGSKPAREDDKRSDG